MAVTELISCCCCLWDANVKTFENSRCYDESWVEKLYRACQRNLTRRFWFICFTDRERDFCDGIEQRRLFTLEPDCGCLIEPFRLGGPSIIFGLDTVILRNIDHLAEYCLMADKIALVRDPYKPEQSINPVALVPKGQRHIYKDWHGENDMQWLRRYPCNYIDDIWPGQALSLKANKVRDVGVGDARIVYMHGRPKPHELGHLDWVREHWR